MAGLSAVLKALGLAARRDLQTYRSFRVNNFFLFAVLLVYGEAQSGLPPSASAPLLVLLGLLSLFPLSSDPLARMPATRALLWPLAPWQWAALRLVSLAFSPVPWVALLMLFRFHKPWLSLTLVAIGVAANLLRRIPWEPAIAVPPLPGALGVMIRGDLRRMFQVLDTYLAIVMSAGGIFYKYFTIHPDPAAFPILAMLVGLALSTYAQCLFGLEIKSSAFTRYRLFPLACWKILLAKDAAFLIVLLILTAPLSPGAGMVFGLAALAIGHHPSVFLRMEQHPWRFTGAKLFPAVVQACCALAFAFGNLWYLSILLYVFSVCVYGRFLSRVIKQE